MSPERNIQELLDAYIEGTLGGTDLERFDRALGEDGSLRDELRLQERIDTSLGRIAAPRSVAAPAAPAHRLSRWKVAAAAVLLLGLSVAVVISNWNVVFPAHHTPDEYAGADGEYRRQVDQGFVPREVCTSDEQFRAYVEERFGTPMLALASEGVELLGWDYSTGVRGYETVVLLVRVDEEPVLVLMDPADRNVRLTLIRPGNLSIFRRDLGDVTLHEVTPGDAPAVLDLFYVPQD